jgi:archaellum component FlaG (FlaF/FlaG flagellin family)
MAAQKISGVIIVAITLAGMLLTVTAASVISVNEALPSRGSVVSSINVEIYSDHACNQRLTSIDWGDISPGGTSSQTLYIKNAGDKPLVLQMTTDNWNPSDANGPITVTWNRENANIDSDQSLQAVLTLTVSSTISGITDFSVDIVITGLDMG